MRFGKWVVLECTAEETTADRVKCKCDCGTIRYVRVGNLTYGESKSCGCIIKENPTNLTHGWSKTRLYSIWGSMISRCHNENTKSYRWYGGKGVSVCDEWRNSFSKFKEWALNNGYDENNKELTIDRIDFNGNYCPDNCRWIPFSEQTKNTSRNRFFDYNGEKWLVGDLAKYFGVSRDVLRYRLDRGKSVENIVEELGLCHTT